MIPQKKIVISMAPIRNVSYPIKLMILFPVPYNFIRWLRERS